MSQSIEYRYKPQGPVLEQYILEQEQRSFIMGPLGSGKTNASCWKGFRIMCGQEPDAHGVRKSRGVAVRNTYPDLFSTTVKDWLDMFGDLGRFVQGGKEPPTHYLRFKMADGTTVEAEVVFLALDREDHVKKLRGFQGTWGWVNEAKEILWTVVEMLDLRMGRYPKDVRPTWYGIWGDTNAPDNDSWYYRLAEEMHSEGWKFFRQPGGVMRETHEHPWQVNPAAENVQNLPLNYYAKGVQGKTDSWVKVNLANEYGFVVDGMPVYPDFVDSAHCRARGFELVPGIGLDIGLDFGLTPAAVIGQRMVNGQMRWRHELVTENTGIRRFARELLRFLSEVAPGYPIASITGDPAGDQRQAGDDEERSAFQLLALEGVIAQPAYSNVFGKRTESVNKLLTTFIDGEPALLVHPDMKVTRNGMAGAYKFRKLQVAGTERYELKPVKDKYSHPCEAGQYQVMGAFGTGLLEANPAGRAADAAGWRAARGLPSTNDEAAQFRARRRGRR